jgi:hypothetical protein
MKLELQEDIFVSSLCAEISTPGVRPIDAIERLISQQLTASVEASVGKPLKLPRVHIFGVYNKNRCPTLPELVKHGYKTWYSEIRFSTDHSTSVEDITIETAGITLDDIDYGWGVNRAYQLKSKKLKKQTNYTLRLNTLRIEGSVFKRVLSKLKGASIDQPYVANPASWLDDYGHSAGPLVFGLVSFNHVVTGDRVYCSCAKPAHEKILANAKSEAPSFVPGSWPHEVVDLLSDAKYLDSICHLCVAKAQGPDAAAAKYGDNMHEFLDPYKEQLVLCSEMDNRTARADVQERLNLSRWVQEAELYRQIKQIFPNELVFREASPPWLGRQRLDVFIPQLRLALEYQGLQHYEAVEAFGGERALLRTLERDALKKRLCDENQIELVYIKFDDPITSASLRHRLRRFIKEH